MNAQESAFDKVIDAFFVSGVAEALESGSATKSKELARQQMADLVIDQVIGTSGDYGDSVSTDRLLIDQRRNVQKIFNIDLGDRVEVETFGGEKHVLHS